MGRVHIPLFPLNTVLFPRMPLPLHVFEERFRRLVERCVEQKSQFGVVLARDPELQGASIARVGTMARIHAVQKLDGGRYNILAVGDERFAVLSRETTPDEYDLALVEKLLDNPADPAYLDPLTAEIRRLFTTYFEVLLSRAGLKTMEYELPTDASELSFVVASVLQLPLERRQQFLESTSTPERLQQEIAWLQRGIRHFESGESAGQIARPIDTSKAREEISRN